MDRITKAKLFTEGRDIARAFYDASNGKDSVLQPSSETIAKLSRLLDLKASHIRRCLAIYLA